MKNLSLRTRVILVVSTIILIITIATIISSYLLMSKEIMKTTKMSQYRDTTFVAGYVQERLATNIGIVKAFAKAFTIDEDKKRTAEYLEELKDLYGFENSSVGFEDGEYVANKSASIPAGFNHKVRPWYMAGIKTDDVYITAPYEDSFTKKILMTMTYPIKKPNGVKGVISVDFKLNIDDFIESITNKELDGRIVVIHNQGLILDAVDKQVYGKQFRDLFTKAFGDRVEYTFTHQDTKYNEPVEYKDNKGNDRIGQVIPVTGYDFVVSYGLDKEKVVRTISSLSVSIAAIIVLIAVVGMVVLYILLRNMLSPLARHAKEIYRLAENKDLSTRLKIERDDEIGNILKAINVLNDSTNVIVNEVRSSIIEVASANDELASTMEELSTTFNSQSEQVTTMVEGIEGISNISKNTSDALSNNMDSLEKTAEATRHETEKLDSVSVKMGGIEEDTITLSETINNLSERSNQIGNILEVINDIANQTNLLALNAAIEAARAGEAGRGFAVVADEVRKLAERTQHATKEIEDIINGLLRDSEEAKVAMDKSVTSVHDGTTNITGVATEIKRAVENVTLLYTAMRPVAESVSEQYVTIQSVVDNAQVIAAGIEESNAAVNEINNTVSHIQQRTDNLKLLIEQFKITK